MVEVNEEEEDEDLEKLGQDLCLRGQRKRQRGAEGGGSLGPELNRVLATLITWRKRLDTMCTMTCEIAS